jgi:hypothetical protein
MVDRVYISTEDRDKYEKLKKEVSFLGDKDAKDLFLFAFVYGVRYNSKKTLTKKDGYFRTEYLKDEDKALLKIVAIFHESFDILNEMDKVLDLAEKYAHAGIDILINELKSKSIGTFEKKLELTLLELTTKS